MEFLAHVADSLDQPALDAHVDILVLHTEYDLPVLDILTDILKSCDDRILLFHRNDPLLAQHGHMRDASVDIIVVHPLVESDGGVELLYDVVHLLLKSSSP